MDGTSQAIVRGGSVRRETSRPLCAITGLGKSYDGQLAIVDISFDVQPGEILGVIGPNGAGKTTLLETLAGLIAGDAGEVRWRGHPIPVSPVSFRRGSIFYVPDGIRPYQDQYVAQVLSFFAGVYRKSTSSVTKAIASVGLEPVLDRRVYTLSKGYSRRLLLALGLLSPHELVLMDEPFDGLDLRQTREIADVLREQTRKGRSLLLAIHQLSDAERVCDRFILLSSGRIRGCGTLGDLRARTNLPGASLEEVFLALT
jgi:ABC-2 type transport system ATP-binding protein